eukprot:m.5566 g.5566  ORF g.5566 m.5566 type:complete len:492 (+) comp2401_c0_seq1:286-1761(+)
MLLVAVAGLLGVLLIKSLFHYVQIFFRNGPTGLPIIGVLPNFIANVHRKNHWYLENQRKYGPDGQPWFFRAADLESWICCDPRDIEHFLKTNFQNYIKGDMWYSIFDDLLGGGIFNVDGEAWRFQRKIAAHQFSVRRFRDIQTSVFVEHAHKLVANIQKWSDTDESFDVQDQFQRFTLDSIGLIAFGVDLKCLDGGEVPFATAFDVATRRTFERFFDPLWKIKRWLNVGSEREMREALQTLDTFLEDRIVATARQENQAGGGKDENLLQHFCAVRDQGGNKINNALLKNITASFVLAGRDTTANALSWALLELCRDTGIQEKLRAEIRRHLHDNDPEYEALKPMHYLQAVIFEVLRLHPSVPEDGKQAVADDVLPSGVHVAAGTHCAYLPWVAGRLPALWGDDCLEFRPERWINDDGTCKRESPFKLTAFQAGPRLCLGVDMAQLEMKIALCTMLQRFSFSLAPEQGPVTYDITLTNPIKGSLLVRAVPAH